MSDVLPLRSVEPVTNAAPEQVPSGIEGDGLRPTLAQKVESVTIDFRVVPYLIIPASAAVILLGIFAEFFVLNVGTGTFLQDLRHFRLDAEVTIPAWYSSALMLVSSALLLLIARRVFLEKQPFAWHWAALGIIFLYMSADESSGIHEVLIDPLQQGFDLHGVLHYAWVIPGAIVVLLIGLMYLKFLITLPRASAIAFVIAGSIYVGGALGMEMVGGYMIEYYGRQSLRYIAAMITEESCEIIGLTLFVLALMRHLRTNFPGMSIRLAP